MKLYLPRIVMGALIAISLTAAGGLRCANAQPAELHGPADMHPELDNATMLVLRIRMAPHEKTPMHELTARFVIWLTDAHLKDTGSDGSVGEYNRPAGSIDWIMPRQHLGENLSDQGLDFLAIIPKVASASGPHGTLPH